MPSYTNDVLSAVLQEIHDTATLGMYRRSNFLKHAKARGGLTEFSGGVVQQVPIETAWQAGVTALSDGYEQINVSHGNTLQKMTFSRGFGARPISISDKERLEDMGEAAMVDLLKVYHDSALNQCMYLLNKQILAGGVAEFADFGTLNGCTTIGVSTGFLEDHTPGTAQVNTVGGLSKATYAGVPALQNQWADIGGNFAANGLAAFRNARDYASLYAPGTGNSFDVILVHPLTLGLLGAASWSNVRYVDVSEVDPGKVVPVWEGQPIEADAAFVGLSNTGNGPLSGLGLNFSGIKLGLHREANFKVGDFVRSPDQAVSTAQLQVMGGLLAYNLSNQAVFTDGNA